MTGLLVVNSFVTSNKFSEIYNLLLASSKKHGIDLCLLRSGELLHNLKYLRELPFDFVLFWDKDILLAKMLEANGLRVFNRATAIEACDDKALTELALQSAEVTTPLSFSAPLTYEGLGYKDMNFLDKFIELLGFPMIVKENHGSFGQQVYLAHDINELQMIVSRAGAKGLLFQKFVASSFGRDVRINVVGGKVVASMLRYSDTGDFRSNISNGGKMKPFEANAYQCDLAIRACNALGLDFAGVDVLFGENDTPIICEVNSNPHFKSTLDCTGINMADHIMEHIAREAFAK